MTQYPLQFIEYLETLPFLGRVSTTQTELEAGEYTELIVTYEVGSAGLADGGWFKLVFKFYSDWALFQTTDPEADNYLSAVFRPRLPFAGESDSTVRELKIRFDQKGHERPYQKAIIVDIVDGYLKPGDRIELRLGDRSFGSRGTRVQTFVEDAFRFRAFVDTVGASRFAAVPGDIVLKIAPGQAAQGTILTPRLIRPQTEFVIGVRLDDIWGNLAPAPAKTGEHFRLDLYDANAPVPSLLRSYPVNWTADKAWAHIHTRFDTEEDIRLELRSSKRKSPWTVSHLTISKDAPIPRALFADLHVHSEDTVGVNNTLTNLTYARDAARLDIVGYTANDFNVSAANWQSAVQTVRALNQPGRFIAYPGTEWCGSSAVGGDRNVVFLGDTVRFPHDEQGRSMRTFDWNEETPSTASQQPHLWPANALHDAYRDLGEKVLLIPHVGGRRAIFDWHDPQLERLVEVASSWGHFDWFYKDALARGLQVGASAAGDEHRGRPGGGAPGVGSFGTYGGLTGVLADSLTPEAVAHALRARNTWATTGKRNVALLHSGSHKQGDAFVASGPLSLEYLLLGDSGWEWIELRDGAEAVLTRNLHEELGYAQDRFRVRWGGARIKDRYRWAEWHGKILIEGAIVQSWTPRGLEHPEETVQAGGNNTFVIRTDTYGDADHVEFVVDSLKNLRLQLTFEIDAYNKAGNPLARNPDKHTPGGSWEISGTELLENGLIHYDLGGAELFVAVERVTAKALPVRIQGSFLIEPLPPDIRSNRALHLFARERDDAKVWTSPLFVHHAL